MPTITITPDMTMEQILEIAPSAQRALFQRYHVGGCSSCGFQPTDTLAQVCKDHNILDVKDVITTIQRAQESDGNIEVAGFVPTFGFYENAPAHFAPSFGASWFDANAQTSMAPATTSPPQTIPFSDPHTTPSYQATMSK